MTGKPGLRRRFLAWVAGVAAVLVVGHAVTWFVVAGRIEAGIQGFVQQAAAYGWAVEAPDGARSGWPLRAAVRLPTVVVVREAGAGTVRGRFADVVVSVGLLAPTAVQVSFEGPATVAAGAGAPVRMEAERAVLLAPLTGAGPVRFDGAGVQAGAVRVGAVRVQATGLVLAAELAGMQAEPPLPAPFDGPAVVSLRAVLFTPLPVRDSPKQAAAAWQAAAGVVELPEFALDWGALHAEGSGRGGLDRDLQPDGMATLRVRGAVGVVDALAKAGLVAPGPATAARGVLQLLMLGAGGGAVVLPIVLRAGTVSVANFPLLRLPRLDWAD